MVHAYIPQHLLDFAEYLQKKDFSDENYDLQCIHRTIINRAYLSTYLHTQEWIIQNGPYSSIREYSKNRAGYHTSLRIALETLNKRKVSLKFEEFIRLRVDADYNIVSIINAEDGKKALDLASQIQNALQ